MRLRPAPLAALLSLLACLGIPRAVVDGAAPWTLPAGDPLNEANARYIEATGGDDLLAAVVVDARGGPRGLLDGPGVHALEAVEQVMEGPGGLLRVRSARSAPLIVFAGGTVTALTPLAPPPEDDAGWIEAARLLAGDPFASALISSDGRVAMTLGWIDRGGEDRALVKEVERALRSGGLDDPTARRLRGLLSRSRLAVVLGDEPGPPDAAVGRAIRASGLATVPGWIEEAHARVRDPAGVASAEAARALAALDLPAGISVTLTGPRPTEDALARRVPRAVRWGLLAILASSGLAGWRIRRRPAEGLSALLAGILTFSGSLGLCGWLGVGLHPWIVLIALLAAAWAAAMVVAGRGEVLRLAPAVAAPAGLVLAAGGGPGAAIATGSALALGLLLAWGLASPGEAARPPRALPRPALGLVVLGLALASLVGRPLGLDPSTMLGPGDPVGAANATLARSLGAAPGAALLYEGGEPRSVARPGALRAIDRLQEALGTDPAIAGSASWADLIRLLHRAVAGSEGGRLPGSAALVDQYLLLFGRPADQRALASPDLDRAVALLRFAPGGGARLAGLSDRFPPGDGAAILVGQAVAMAVAARARSEAAALGLALGLILLALALPRSDRTPVLAWTLGCAALAVAVSAASSGSLGLSAWTAGGAAAGGSAATLLGGGGRVAVVPLLAVAALALSAVALYAGFALGLGAGLALALAVDSRARDT